MRSVLLLGLMALILYPAMSAAATLDRIKKNGVVNIGYREDAPPFSFRDSVGDPVGYTVDLCRAVVANLEEQLGLASISIDYVAVSAENRFEAIRDGRIDLLCGPTGATLSGRALVDFSLPTFVDGAGVLFLVDGPVDRGIADGIADRKQRGLLVGVEAFQVLSGLKVGVRAGTAMEKVLRYTLAKRSVDAEIISVAVHEDGLRQLEVGQISAYFADQGILPYLMSKSQAPRDLRLSKLWVGLVPKRLRAAETPEEEFLFPRPDLQHLLFTREPYALALPLGDGDFRLAIDRALSHIYRSGAVWQIFTRYFGRAKPSDALRVLYVISTLPE